mmetsp:Transcript_4257/g.4675  ORF Transcript_4257/g.4675 Transcript_4257/m.4675 type:complete len:466 (-) Transcript_4257:46-1443(-)
MLTEIEDAKDFTLLYKALSAKLNNPIDANDTYFPSSTKQLSCHQEVLMLLWHFLQSNTKFLNHVLHKEDINTILYPLLHYMYEGRNDQAQMGLNHLGIFTLLYLSGERLFSVALNKPFNKVILTDLPRFANGTFADYLLLVLLKLLVDGHESLEGLWECIMTIMANVSPYVKSMTMVTSAKLLKLFESLIRPKFLLVKEKNHRFLFFIIEMFNNILQYQYEGNNNLIYCLIRHRESFQNLDKLVIDDALLESLASVLEKANNTNSKKKGKTVIKSKKKVKKPKETGDATPAKKEEKKPTTSDKKSGKEEETDEKATPVKDDTKPDTKNIEEAKPEKESKVASGEKKPRKKRRKKKVWEPTNAWLNQWRSSLPSAAILKFISVVEPEVNAMVTGSASDEVAIISYLKKTTLVGLLPVPHPILIRRYKPNLATLLWFHSYMWGIVVVRNLSLGIFLSKIKLFSLVVD